MDLTAFNARLGQSQGRIFLDDDEGHIFVLGDNQIGYYHELNAGDHVEATQETDLTDLDLICVHAVFSVPVDLPVGFAWEVSIVVDGVKLARATCSPGRTWVITDLTANVSKLSGVHPVGVRLGLVEV